MKTKNVILGRWRPVQGLMQAYAVFAGIRGLFAGPTPGQPLETLLQGEPSWVALLFFISLAVGGITAIIGESIQLSCPMIGATAKDLNRLVVGQVIERAGVFLIAANYGAYATCIILSPGVVDSRSYPYIAIALGFLGRFCQLYLENKRLTGNGVVV